MILSQKYSLEDEKENFAILRFIFYTLLLFFVKTQYIASYSQLPKQLWLPTGIFQIFNEPIVFNPQAFIYIDIIWKGLAIFCASGWEFRIFSKIFFVLTFILFNISHNYGYQTHTNMPLVLASFALAFCGNHRIFCVRALFCAVFLSAGLSKLRNGGLDWITTENLQNVLVRSQIYYHDLHPLAHKVRLNIIFAKLPLFLNFSAAFIVIIELISPLALLSKRFRLWGVLLLLVSQIIIYFTIYVNFAAYLVLYAFWIDWSRVHKYLYRFTIGQIGYYD